MRDRKLFNSQEQKKIQEQVKVLKEKRDLIDKMILNLENPAKNPNPAEAEIRTLTSDLGEVMLVNGWGGGFGNK